MKKEIYIATKPYVIEANVAFSMRMQGNDPGGELVHVSKGQRFFACRSYLPVTGTPAVAIFDYNLIGFAEYTLIDEVKKRFNIIEHQAPLPSDYLKFKNDNYKLNIQ